MSTTQPGWHPDPVPPAPGQPPLLRYWDGTRWTDQTAPVAPPASSTQYAPYPVQAGAAYGVKPPLTTPDGAPLAGWWMRVLALVIDSILLGIVGALVALPWWRDAFHIYKDWFDDILSTSVDSGDQVDTTQLQRDLAKPLAIIGAINLALGFVYNVGFLMWKQATPGKLLLGLRVRLREQPGPMPIGTVLMRWVGQYAVGILALIPFVGTIGGLYSILDYLWPLWDGNKQAIHDKVAKTNVISLR